jgi:hypothetical protein
VAADPAGSPQQPGTSDEDIARGRRIGVGCFATFVGFWSGGMIAVLIGTTIGKIRGCTAIEGTSVCDDWFLYAAAGMILGAVTLPTLVLRRLSRKQPQ